MLLDRFLGHRAHRIRGNFALIRAFREELSDGIGIGVGILERYVT